MRNLKAASPPLPEDAVHVTSAEFVRHFGQWQDRANKGPIVVTHHGRSRLIVLSPDAYVDLASTAGHRTAGATGASPQDVAELEIVADRLDECFIAFDHDLRVVRVNSATAVYMRMARGQIENRTLAESVPQSSGSLAVANVVNALETGQATTFEVQSMAYPGRWLQVKTFPFPTGSACLFRDVTQQVEAREAVDVESATRQALLAHGLVGRCVLTARATFREVDSAFAGMLDLEPHGLLRARFFDIFPVNRRARAREAVETVMETGKPYTLNTRLLRRGHAEEAVRLSFAALNTGQDRGMVVIATRDQAGG